MWVQAPQAGSVRAELGVQSWALWELSQTSQLWAETVPSKGMRQRKNALTLLKSSKLFTCVHESLGSEGILGDGTGELLLGSRMMLMPATRAV